MRTLLVEDEAELGGLISAHLKRAGHACDHVEGVIDADAALKTVRYDIILLDLGLRDGDGLDLLRAYRAGGGQAGVLILTARDALEDRVAGLDAGADDYVVKPVHLDELHARMRAIARRPATGRPRVLEEGNLSYDAAARMVCVGGRPIQLSRRELGLLALMLERRRRVVTKDDIDNALYGFGEPIGPNAIEVLVHRLRKRLHEEGAEIGITTIRGLGYMLDSERP